MDGALKIKRRRRASLEARKARAGYIFTAPFILGIILIYIPILLDSVWFSFNDFTWVTVEGIQVKDYHSVGFQHYASAFGSQAFISNLLAGLQQLVFEVPAIIIFSLFIAVVLNQKMLGRAAFRAIFFVPVIIATGLMDSINGTTGDMTDQMQNTNDGSAEGSGGFTDGLGLEALLSTMAVGQGLVDYVVRLVDSIIDIINYSGVQMLIFLAGLQSISPSIYEACRIDGATGWETFWKVTFPMISPMILVNAVYTVIDSFTRTSNPTMSYIASSAPSSGVATAMYWIYFVIVILVIAVVAGLASTFIFYQRKD